MDAADAIAIRPETRADRDAIRRVNDAAFGTPGEARLVDLLRGVVRPLVSLVAERGAAVVGHILFTPVQVVGTEQWPAMALGPMAVTPADQRRGVGSALVRRGLDVLRADGHDVVFVLGHPEFYPRFGFRPAPPLGLTCRWDVPPEVFMVAELAAGALGGRTGRVEYHDAFLEV